MKLMRSGRPRAATSFAYRADIDGLRAISVLAVIFFHADLSLFRGGFVGVDVFFVISGFVITSLITKECAAGTFSLVKFYERRVRRLFPTAIIVLITTSAFALAFFTPAELEDYCYSLLATSLFAANWFFLNDISYFATATDQKLLLHTWSLSIEEQFYIIYPTLLLLLRSSRARIAGLSILATASFAYAAYLWSSGQFDQAFYDSFARFWELLLGCLTALLSIHWSPTRLIGSILRSFGLVAILFSIISFRAGIDNNALHLFLPTIGSAAVLMAFPDSRSTLCRIISSSPFRWTGLLSYALYMWHWPILGFVRLLNGEMTALTTMAAVVVIFGLSVLTFFAIERPIRYGLSFKARWIPGVIALVGFLAVAPICVAGIVTKGLPVRLPPGFAEAVRAYATENPEMSNCFNPPDYRSALVQRAKAGSLCVIGDRTKDRIDFILWGDSHAFALTTAFNELGKQQGRKGLLAAYAACPPVLNTAFSKPGAITSCPQFNDAVLDLIKRENIPIVYMVSRWSFYVLSGLPGSADRNDKAWLRYADNPSRELDAKAVFKEALSTTLQALEERKIVILNEVPQQRVDVPSTFVSSAMLNRDPSHLWMTRNEYLARNTFVRDLFKSLENVTIIDPAATLCAQPICLVQQDGKPIYIDDDHLNTIGARLLIPLIAPTFEVRPLPDSTPQRSGL